MQRSANTMVAKTMIAKTIAAKRRRRTDAAPACVRA
jgi:hypothetical protein